MKTAGLSGILMRKYAVIISAALLVFSDHQISSQSFSNLPVRSEEKRPAPEDPSYTAPLLPPSLRSSVNTMNPAMMLDPGKISPDAFRKHQEDQALIKKKRHDRKLETELKNIPEGNERAVLERTLLHQFGTEVFPEYAGRHDPYYTETALRRFQIIFFLSLPVTAAGIYGTAQAIRSVQKHSGSVYNGPETAAMVAASLLTSSIIAWYDHVMWKREQTDSAAFLFPDDTDRLHSYNKTRDLHLLSLLRAAGGNLQTDPLNGISFFYSFSF